MRLYVRRSVVIATLLAGCAGNDRATSGEDPNAGRETKTLEHELPDEYTWLVDHGASVACSEYQAIERGEILWDKVLPIRQAHPQDPGFITKQTLIRVLSPQLLAEYKQAVAELANASDPAAISDVRARLHLQSALAVSENKHDLRALGLDPHVAKLVPARIAELPAGCAPPPPPPPPARYYDLAIDQCGSGSGSGSGGGDGSGSDVGVDAGTGSDTGSGTGGGGIDAGSGSGSGIVIGDAGSGSGSGVVIGDAGSGSGSGSGVVIADAGSGSATPMLAAVPFMAPLAPADVPAPVCDTCKVICDLSVAVDAVGATSVSSKKDVTKKFSDGTWQSDTTPGDGTDYSVVPTRYQHITTAVTCTATGCDKSTWKANATPGNLGDGTMSVNIAGSTTNPDFSTDINSSCSVSVNALAQSSLTMDKNADDCAAANKNPTFDHKMEILYAVHTETSTDSSTETSGSVGVTYEANQNATSGANANIKASGAGKDGLTIDGVNVTGQIGNQSNVSYSGKAAASYAYRRAKKEQSTWQAGSTTLALMDQINGPPSLTLTNECPQKTVNYKYDLSNFRSIMKWQTNSLNFSNTPLCSSRIEANLPTLPATVNFKCTYTTSASTDAKDCTGKLTKP